MNRADAINLDELKMNHECHITPMDKFFDPLIVEKSEFLYTICNEGLLSKELETKAREKLFELIKSF